MTTEHDVEERLSRRNLLDVTGAIGVAVVAAAAAIPDARAQAAGAPRGSKLRDVLDRGKLIVGTGTDVPPLYFRDQNGRVSGFDPDVARLVAKGLFNDPGKVEFVVQGSDARIPSLLSDRVDIVFQNLTVTPQRALQVEFTIPYYRAANGLLLLASGPYKDYAALKAAGAKVTVSTLQNVMIENWIRLALPEAKVDQYPSPDAALQALNAGRSDALVGDGARMRWAASQFSDRYRDSGFNWLPNTIAGAVKPGDQTWLNWLNTTLREAMAGVEFPSLAETYKRWMGISLKEPTFGFPHEYAAG